MPFAKVTTQKPAMLSFGYNTLLDKNPSCGDLRRHDCRVMLAYYYAL